MGRKNRICTLNLSYNPPAGEEAAVCPTRKRLTEAVDCLNTLEHLRAHGRDPVFGKFVEERIIWRELLELELQELDLRIPRTTPRPGR